METIKINLSKSLYLEQSELYGNIYHDLDFYHTSTFNDVSIDNIPNWQNSLFAKYSFLNNLQKDNLELFFLALKEILSKVDPEKLKLNNDSIPEENDILFWRENNKGVSKLIFDKYGEITYVFNGYDGKKIRGVFDKNVDFEKLLYRFFQ